MKNQDQVQLLNKIAHLTEDEKLELFNVEELENRLEMTAVIDGEDPIVIDGNGSCNGSCWWEYYLKILSNLR